MWRFSQDADEEQQDYLLEGTEGLCSLSPLQRIYAFAACLLAGFVCMFLSLIVFAKPIKFALLFTFGNMFAVGSTAFLIGPGQQLRMMFYNVRFYATAVYVACVVVALVCALLIHSKILTVIAVICEICALICKSCPSPIQDSIVHLITTCCGNCVLTSAEQPFGPLQTAFGGLKRVLSFFQVTFLATVSRILLPAFQSLLGVILYMCY